MENIAILADRVRETVNQNNMLDRGDCVVIGLSGGPDSVCLFLLLCEMREEYGLSLRAVHVNHGLRPGAADDDQAYCERLCAEHDVPLDVTSVDLMSLAEESGETPEEAGRTVRYEAFARTASAMRGQKGAIPKIAVAHNKNDQIETVLMRIIRGTGTDGLAGIPYTRVDAHGNMIVRPLLDTSRDCIEKYLTDKNVSPCRDHTNDESKYFRNRVRLDLIPYIAENYGEAAVEAIARLSINAAEDKDFFEQKVRRAIAQHAQLDSFPVSFPLDILNKMHPSLKYRLITEMFAKRGLIQDIEKKHLDAAAEFLKKSETGKAIHFPGGFRLGISYGQAVFLQGMFEMQKVFDERYSLNRCDDGVFRAHYGRDELCIEWKTLDGVDLAPEWRTRRPGDIMRPRGLGGTKKLQDIFTDKKVPREERDSVMLLAHEKEILWIPRLRLISEAIGIRPF